MIRSQGNNFSIDINFPELIQVVSIYIYIYIGFIRFQINKSIASDLYQDLASHIEFDSLN